MNKTFYQQDNIGKAKYTISFHNGVKKHKDGSKFFNIKIFKNKISLSTFRKELLEKGYTKYNNKRLTVELDTTKAEQDE